MGFFDFFIRKDLSSVLNQTYKIKVHGVVFEVRKLNPLDFIAGTKALSQFYDTYKTEGEKRAQIDAVLTNQNKLKEHYGDVFLAAVVNPKLVRKQEDSDKGIWVQNLFTDWELANELYTEIAKLTYGKKKVRQYTSLKKNLSI